MEILLLKLKELLNADTDLKRNGLAIQAITITEDTNFGNDPRFNSLTKASVYEAISMFNKDPKLHRDVLKLKINTLQQLIDFKQ